MLSNRDFARAVGCHITTASRYRNGHRLPGVEKLEGIRRTLGVSYDEIYAEWRKGKESFGAYLRERVFPDEIAV